GIAAVTERGQYDLVLIGATNQWHARKALFGSVPDKLLNQRDSTLTLGVMRQAVPLMTKTTERVRNLFKRGVPQLERDDRVALVERIQGASEWNVDFVALICLSTIIATLGLMQDSAAVVIGAMLVAPLMTPLVGCGLAVVQGNGQLIRSASKSVVLGFFLAIAIAALMGLVLPHSGLTPQMLSRGQPNALDLGVALISGLAAAYATARPNLLGALPGVAIAAALVPPIATSGVALADGQPVVAAGAAMLFLTNIVAIILGAAMALFAVGMQAQHLQARSKRWTRHATMGLTVGAVVLSVPLIYWLYDSLPSKALSDDLQALVEHHVDQAAHWELVEVMPPDRDGQVMVLEVVVSGERPADAALANDIAEALQQAAGKPVAVRVTTQLTVNSATP
ncbi:MAG: TIGR00341 family protein, partial [Planctomycetota bacterium]